MYNTSADAYNIHIIVFQHAFSAYLSSLGTNGQGC